MTEPPAHVVDALYGGDPAAFVAARDAAVRELRGAGRRDEAAAVKALARPTVAAAGVNRVVRSGAAEPLWIAGDELAAAQAALLAGDADAAALREAKARHEAALDEVVAAAGEGARETLRAASVDAAVREQVASGRLEREPAPGSGGGGFGGLEAFAVAPEATKARPVKAGAKPKGGAKAKAGAKAKGTAKPTGEAKPKAKAGAKARAEAESKAEAQARADAEARARAEAEAEATAAAERKAQAAEAAKARKALGRSLDTARARAARSGAALDAARERLERAAESHDADAEAVAALEAELAQLDA